MKKRVLLSLAFTCASALACAAPLEFDFKDPKGVNNVVFKTDAPLESINGTATGVAGKVTFDPDNPGAVTGRIVVAANSLHVPNPTMKEHLHGDGWLDVAKHPDITFEVVSAKNVKTEGTVTTADVAGKMTLKGATKELTVPVKLTYLKDKLGHRVPGKKGDLLVLRANFTIKRSDFGINSAKFEEKVSNEIELSLSLAGAAPKS
jgi:polyisoprenoid-binding protein YceI